MRRPIFLLILGIFFTALLGAAISVYMFHDVDQDKIGHWDEAFAGQCVESVIFALIIGGTVALLTLLGRQLFRLKSHSPRAKLGLFLGIGVTAFQYVWDFIARKEVPRFADSALALYLVVAIVFCTVVLLGDSFIQKNHEAFEELPPV